MAFIRVPLSDEIANVSPALIEPFSLVTSASCRPLVATKTWLAAVLLEIVIGKLLVLATTPKGDKKDKEKAADKKESAKETEEPKKKFGFPRKKKDPSAEDHNHKDTHRPGTVLEPEEGAIVPETKVDADIEDPSKALSDEKPSEAEASKEERKS